MRIVICRNDRLPMQPYSTDRRGYADRLASYCDQTRTTKLVELVSLKKTNGQMQEAHGTKVYTLFYEARIHYLTPVGHWKTGDIQTTDSNYGFQPTENGWQGPDGTTYSK